MNFNSGMDIHHRTSTHDWVPHHLYRSAYNGSDLASLPQMTKYIEPIRQRSKTLSFF